MFYSKAFKATTISATFNQVIEADASNGRVSSALLVAITADYGFTLPAAPSAFIAKINSQFLAGACKANTVPLVQALHQCATAVIKAGKAKNLPALLALPASACPVAIKTKADATKAKTAETKAAKVTAPTITGATLDVEGDAQRTIAAIKSQALKPATLDALRVALGLAVPAPM